MKREEIKSYKDACKVIGRKPRTYKDKHLNLYEQLSTIIAASILGCIKKMNIINLRVCSVCFLTMGWLLPLLLSGLL